MHTYQKTWQTSKQVTLRQHEIPTPKEVMTWPALFRSKEAAKSHHEAAHRHQEPRVSHDMASHPVLV